jgi:DNA helicase HerA-like ATPase
MLLPFTVLKFSTGLMRFILERRRAALLERALVALNYFSADVAKFYFGKAREINAAGILSSAPPMSGVPRERLHVVDIPSLRDHSIQLLAISAVLETEWRQARSDWENALTQPSTADARVPTFIVIDEAHNLVPDDVTGIPEAKLREQFRTIVAEGRKFGVFLILVSQRPDKLDRRVLSECENKALMRLDSKFVLDLTTEMLGLQDVPERMLEKTLGFGIGRALLLGRWAGGTPKVLYSAARRTVEGGRNLRPAHWATPPEMPRAETKKSATRTRVTRARRRRGK